MTAFKFQQTYLKILNYKDICSSTLSYHVLTRYLPVNLLLLYLGILYVLIDEWLNSHLFIDLFVGEGDINRQECADAIVSTLNHLNKIWCCSFIFNTLLKLQISFSVIIYTFYILQHSCLSILNRQL